MTGQGHTKPTKPSTPCDSFLGWPPSQASAEQNSEPSQPSETVGLSDVLVQVAQLARVDGQEVMSLLEAGQGLLR